MTKPTIKNLIDSEIADFAAGLGQPGYCETPEAIQNELLERFARISAIVDLYISGAKDGAEQFAVNESAVDAVRPGKINGFDWIDWNEISSRGLLKRINQEILHPLGLAVFRDPSTGRSGGALIASDGVWDYAKDLNNSIKH